MKLYYGSETLFTEPIFGEGKITNDYGLGLYMTDSFDLAKLWASKSLNGGYVLSFDFDLNDLNVLNLKDYGEENALKWITILVNHRFDLNQKETYQAQIDWLNKKFRVNLDAVDVIIGYRADDSYFNYSKSFVANTLSLEILTEAMRIGKLGLQYVAISKKAFKRLKFINSVKVEHTDEYSVFQRKALEEYNELKKEDNINNTFIRDLMRKYGN